MLCIVDTLLQFILLLDIVNCLLSLISRLRESCSFVCFLTQESFSLCILLLLIVRGVLLELLCRDVIKGLFHIIEGVLFLFKLVLRLLESFSGSSVLVLVELEFVLRLIALFSGFQHLL